MSFLRFLEKNGKWWIEQHLSFGEIPSCQGSEAIDFSKNCLNYDCCECNKGGCNGWIESSLPGKNK